LLAPSAQMLREFFEEKRFARLPRADQNGDT
jgi:hypothetical protein